MRFAYKFNFSIDMFDAHKSPVLDVAQTFVNLRWFCRITWVSLRYEYQYSLKYYLTCIFIKLNLWIVVKMLENVHPVANPIEMQYIFKYKLCAMHYKWYCHCDFEFRLVSSVSSWTQINKMKDKKYTNLFMKRKDLIQHPLVFVHIIVVHMFEKSSSLEMQQ